MINRILAVGDSFTYGEELDDRASAWPIQLSRLTNSSVLNLGQKGGGNKQMIRNVIDTVCGNTRETEPFDLIVIGWTSPGRMEFADDCGIFDLWPGYGGTMFRKDGQNWRLELLDYINKYHNSEHIYQQYLFDVVMMQSFLNTQGIKYVMLNVCSNEYYHNTYYSKMRQRTSLIDPSGYLGWPTKGMAEWTDGCKRGPNGHFLEDGHKKVAIKLYEHIRNLGWLS
jgi:hypothetical protein